MQGFSIIRLLAGLFLAALALAPESAALAETRAANRVSQSIVVAQSGGKTLGDAVSEVQRRYGGRIVSAHTEVRNGREIHVVKVLTEKGRVRTVRVSGRKVGRN